MNHMNLPPPFGPPTPVPPLPISHIHPFPPLQSAAGEGELEDGVKEEEEGSEIESDEEVKQTLTARYIWSLSLLK